MTCGGLAAISPDACAQQAGGAAVHAIGGDAGITLRGNHAGIADVAADRKNLVAACIQAARVNDVAGAGGKVCPRIHGACVVA